MSHSSLPKSVAAWAERSPSTRCFSRRSNACGGHTPHNFVPYTSGIAATQRVPRSGSDGGEHRSGRRSLFRDLRRAGSTPTVCTSHGFRLTISRTSRSPTCAPSSTSSTASSRGSRGQLTPRVRAAGDLVRALPTQGDARHRPSRSDAPAGRTVLRCASRELSRAPGPDADLRLRAAHEPRRDVAIVRRLGITIRTSCTPRSSGRTRTMLRRPTPW